VGYPLNIEYTLNGNSGKPNAVAIVTASRYGQTSKIAQVIAQQLNQLGVHAKHIAFEQNETPETVDWSHFDSIIIGCPVYKRKFLPEMLAWTKAHSNELAKMKRGFFSVSMNAAVASQAARVEDDRLLHEFILETGYKPHFVASIAGKLHYKAYGFFRRLYLCRTIGIKHWPAGISKDHERTDWHQVSAFAAAFAQQDHMCRFAAGVHFHRSRSIAA